MLLYSVEVCRSAKMCDNGTLGSKVRYYVVKTDGMGVPFKERISKARYDGFENQAFRMDTFHGNVKRGVHHHHKSLYFHGVPHLYG